MDLTFRGHGCIFSIIKIEDVRVTVLDHQLLQLWSKGYILSYIYFIHWFPVDLVQSRCNVEDNDLIFFFWTRPTEFSDIDKSNHNWCIVQRAQQYVPYASSVSCIFLVKWLRMSKSFTLDTPYNTNDHLAKYGKNTSITTGATGGTRNIFMLEHAFTKKPNTKSTYVYDHLCKICKYSI